MRLRPTSLTIAHSNLALLASLAAVLAGSFVMTGWPTYRVLAIREGLLILLPACLMVLILKLPAVGKTRLLRLRWPGGRVAAASALIGAGGWLVDSWLGVGLYELLGYTTPLPPDFFPTTPDKAFVLLAVLAILAPICEETLFRGVIQRGYEELSPRASILAGGALFALFHQSLPQGLALLPLAFLLGYMVWRSDSLWSGIIAHATNNALAGALIVAATADPEVAPFVGTLPAALIGATLAAIGLWGFRRWAALKTAALKTAALKTAAPETAKPQRGVGFWVVRLWPFFLIVPIVTLSIGLEAALGWFPEALALGQPVRWSSPPWDGPHIWAYEIRNVLNEPAGRAQCALALEGDAYTLTCDRQQSAYEADTGDGVYRGQDIDEQFTARWQRSSLRLSSVDRHTQVTATDGEARLFQSSVVRGADSVEVAFGWQENTPLKASFPLVPSSSPLQPGRTFEPVVLEAGEWPWRLSALPFDGFYSAQATLIEPDAWNEGMKETSPAAERSHVVVYGAEPIKTPAGTFIAWQVRVGDNATAWYDVEKPHTLVALEVDLETWGLTSVE